MLYAIVGMLVIIADQYIKFWVQGHIALTSTGEEFIPGILSLVNVHNDGAAFGFLAGSGARIPFIILAGVFTLAVIIALATNLISGKLARWSIVLVTAGGLSNCLDRVLYGYVQDMFKTEFMNFPVFNLADVFITVFAIIFALAVIFGKTRKDRDDDYEFEDEEEEYAPRRASRKKQKRARRAAVEEDEEEEPVPATPAPAPARRAAQQPERQLQKAKAAAKSAAAKTVEDDDPFAGWERTSAKTPARQQAAAKSAARTASAAQPVKTGTAPRSAAKPAAAQKPAAAKPAAKPATKPVVKPAVEEEFSLDDILNEFK